jgi:hypothetical protein
VNENIEENKIPPNTTNAYDLQGQTVVKENEKVNYTSSEEARQAHDFIGIYKGLKRVQDYKNQEIMKDLPEERYYGNTEYKLKLCTTSQERITRLTTQMKFRLEEGSGEAFYVIGASDNGEATGLPSDEMETSLRILLKMANYLNLKLTIRSVRKGKNGEIVKARVA